MDYSTKVELLLSLSENKEISNDLKEKLSSKSEFIAIHSFEPTELITVSQVNQFVLASKIVGECGGRYILFIADIASSLNNSFERIKHVQAQYTKYAIETLKASGVDGPHVQIVISDDYTMNNFELFTKFAEITTHISATTVQKALPNLGKKKNDVITAANIISPILKLSELLDFKPDIIFTDFENLEVVSLISYLQKDNLPIIIPFHSIMKLKGVNSNPPTPDPKNILSFLDEEKTIQQKISGAFCTDSIQDNPIFELIKYLILPRFNSFKLNEKIYNSIDEIILDFEKMDKKLLKLTIFHYVEMIIQPVRMYLLNPEFEEMINIVKLNVIYTKDGRIDGKCQLFKYLKENGFK